MKFIPGQIRDTIISALIALTILSMVGFAPGVFHNGAHDLRHAFAIPCH